MKKLLTSALCIAALYGCADKSRIVRHDLVPGELTGRSVTLEEHLKDIEAVSKQIEQTPNNALLYAKRVELYRDTDTDQQKALADYNKALELDPTNPDFYNERGVFYHGKGIRIADENNIPNKNLPLAIKGYVKKFLANQEDLEKSIEDFLAVVRFAKNEKDVKAGYWHAGESYFFLDDYPKAIEMMNKTIELFPNDPETYWHRILINEMAGKYAESIPDWNTVVKLAPLNAANRLARAGTLEILGRYKEAIDDYDFIINTINNESFLAYESKSKAHEELGNYTTALNDLKKARELSPIEQKGYAQKINELELKTK